MDTFMYKLKNNIFVIDILLKICYIIKQDVSLASQRFNKNTENNDVSLFFSIFIISYVLKEG